MLSSYTLIVKLTRTVPMSATVVQESLVWDARAYHMPRRVAASCPELAVGASQPSSPLIYPHYHPLINCKYLILIPE